MNKNVHYKAINTIRTLGIDAIAKANSGHPGMVMGAAPMAWNLFSRHLRTTPANDKWINRDRFILSAGHGSMLLYGLLHLFNFDLSIEDIKNFRQLHSKTPGHPEFGHTKGVDYTTGPLGQGIAMGVGSAMAEEFLSAKFNKPKFNIFDHYTYVLTGDGCLQEGVALEAMSLAGRQRLSKLIVLHDSNDVQLDGPLNMAFREDLKKKMESQGWDYQLVRDGNDIEEINDALMNAKKTKKPSFIEIKTTIGYGSKLEGKSETHGAPLTAEDITYAKKRYGWKFNEFEVPREVAKTAFNVNKKNETLYKKHVQLVKQYSKYYPVLGKQLEKAKNGQFEVDFTELQLDANQATRNTSGATINYISKKLPTFFGGSADLTKSTKAKGADGDFDVRHRLGRNINFGVREFAMASIANGMSAYGCIKPFVSTFFVFSDYLKPAARLASLMGTPTLFVFTHDTVFVGEDGPTHEPIEQLAMLRSIPNFNVIRPADETEVVAAYKMALESKKTPTAIVLTRQNITSFNSTSVAGAEKGAYIIRDSANAKVTLLATGSELGIAMQVANEIDARVVSMPSTFMFDNQEESYKKSVLGNLPVVSLEAGTTFGWHKYTINGGFPIGIDRFGLSGEGQKIYEELGFNSKTIIGKINQIIK